MKACVVVETLCPLSGFSLSFEVNGQDVKVGGLAIECRRQELLGRSGGMLPQKNMEKLEPQRCYFMHFGEGFSQKSYL